MLSAVARMYNIHARRERLSSGKGCFKPSRTDGQHAAVSE